MAWTLCDMEQQSRSNATSFSTPSVAGSLEFTETNAEGIDASEQQAPMMDQDAVVNDTESESDKEETPAGAASSVLMQQVCLFFIFNSKMK